MSQPSSPLPALILEAVGFNCLFDLRADARGRGQVSLRLRLAQLSVRGRAGLPSWNPFPVAGRAGSPAAAQGSYLEVPE